MHKYTNRLIDETSPYLQQHAHNPVDWYPWGGEALSFAREQNKPILLSIGYSACHWCHVMEKESFEDEETAQLMNRLFVNIKVDREERPDIDQRYMEFVQTLTGSGGWPLTVFLTPDGVPFYGGTYFPPEDRYGKPAFKKLLVMVSDYYHKNRQQLEENLDKIREIMARQRREIKGRHIPDTEAWNQAVQRLTQFYDALNGGMGQAPKFPAVQVFSLFLRKFAHHGDKQFLSMAEHTLQRMANGGIYDQLGGGFARYAVDEKWRVPHFEKMLYDNAQLTSLYIDAYRLTQNPFYLQIARETLDFVRRELTNPDGGFYSSLDADSEGQEGKFYLWSKDEILKILGDETGRLFCARFGVTDGGNFEGSNILFISKSFDELAAEFKKTPEEIEALIGQARKKMLTEREQRIRPGLDYKALTSWNGLMLSAFAAAYQVTLNPTYAAVIDKNIDFVRRNLYQSGRLLHVYSKGQSKIDAFVDDYAYLIQGLLDAYEALFDEHYLQMAVELTRRANDLFWDKRHGGYFFEATGKNQAERHFKSETDASQPSPTAVMLHNQLRLFHFTGEQLYLQTAERLMRKYGQKALENPYAFASFLNALDFYLSQPLEILILKEDQQRFDAFQKLIFRRYLPNKVVLVQTASSKASMGRPLLQGRESMEGKTTAFICHGQSCSLPVTTVDGLKQILEKN